jgi:hypothetical protein
MYLFVHGERRRKKEKENKHLWWLVEEEKKKKKIKICGGCLLVDGGCLLVGHKVSSLSLFAQLCLLWLSSWTMLPHVCFLLFG